MNEALERLTDGAWVIHLYPCLEFFYLVMDVSVKFSKLLLSPIDFLLCSRGYFVMIKWICICMRTAFEIIQCRLT